jgi:hypothetical protein
MLRTFSELRTLMTLADIGGERGPVTLVAFKAMDSVLRGQNGGFDSHTLPPFFRRFCRKMGHKRSATDVSVRMYPLRLFS